MTEVTARDLSVLIGRIAETMTREKDRLCELDGIIGDGDHGIAMELGFQAAAKATAALDLDLVDPTTVLNTAAKTFLNAVGASSGPLYATGLMRAAAAVKGKLFLTADAIVELFVALAKGIEDRGKAVPGEKTMVDAWAPAAAALVGERQRGGSLAASFQAALAAADAGALSTRDMIATKGRSARLGERSLGHTDPGAASAALIISCISAFFNFVQ